MIELWESDDPADARLALRAPATLRAFNEAGVLEAADIHVAQRLTTLLGEPDERVALALALASRAVRHGSVALDLAQVPSVAPDLPWPAYDDWLGAVTASPLVDQQVLHVERGLVYLDRYHRQEAQVFDDLTARAARPAPPVDQPLLTAALDRLLGGPGYAEQRAACDRAARQWTTVLTGGPGTGKTTTVARLLVVLAEQLEVPSPGSTTGGGRPPRIALAAPTGKAAARLQEQVHREAARLESPEDATRLEGVRAVTLHRLLGFRPDNQTRFRHHRGNRLPYDVVLVDETSMVSLTMMARLLEAVRPDARLVLVGDPDQLASIEAGAVLTDLVEGYAARDDSPVARLTTVHRYGAHIGALAGALRDGDAEAVLDVLRAGHDRVEWIDVEDPTEAVRASALPAALAVRRAALAGDVPAALAALDSHRLLCAHRDTVRWWNHRVEGWVRDATGDPLHDPMYVGRPLLVTSNDYGLGVHNGDTGVVVRADDGRRRVAIAGAGGALDFAPTRLNDVDTMHAMTIHKSQGSQALEVTVVLPDEESRLLTCELLYTAVTRASERVRIVGSEAAVRAAVGRRAQRASGLSRRLGP